MNKVKEMQMEKAMAFLLNKSKLKSNEAQTFKELFSEWSPNGVYPMHSYVTHGIDELGNKKLFFVNAPVEESNTRVPGNESVSGFTYYSYSQDPNIGKEDE